MKSTTFVDSSTFSSSGALTTPLLFMFSTWKGARELVAIVGGLQVDIESMSFSAICISARVTR
jgi:hypothetical protein